MVQIGDRVQVGPDFASGVVVGIIPANEYRDAMYRIRFDHEIPAPTLTTTPNESWVDEGLILARL